MIGRIGVPEIVIILFISLLTFLPIAVALWLGLNFVRRSRTKQRELEARIEALERAQRRP
jgi:hypothetical protein